MSRRDNPASNFSMHSGYSMMSQSVDICNL
jgi:hypothetical protein